MNMTLNLETNTLHNVYPRPILSASACEASFEDGKVVFVIRKDVKIARESREFTGISNASWKFVGLAWGEKRL